MHSGCMHVHTCIHARAQTHARTHTYVCIAYTQAPKGYKRRAIFGRGGMGKKRSAKAYKVLGQGAQAALDTANAKARMQKARALKKRKGTTAS